MGAWGTTLDPTGKSGIRFLADPHGELTSALDLSFDGSAIFGNARSKRYALVVEDGKVTQAHVEPDNTGLNGKFHLRFVASYSFLPPFQPSLQDCPQELSSRHDGTIEIPFASLSPPTSTIISHVANVSSSEQSAPQRRFSAVLKCTSLSNAMAQPPTAHMDGGLA